MIQKVLEVKEAANAVNTHRRLCRFTKYDNIDALSTFISEYSTWLFIPIYTR